MKILVTGSNGLVGNAIKKVALTNPQFNFIFVQIKWPKTILYEVFIFFHWIHYQ
jgi:uncharacterized protein YbjT (DUF2867 family)